MFYKHQNFLGISLLISTLLPLMPSAFAQSAGVDKQGNVWGGSKAVPRPQEPQRAFSLRNCHGAVLRGGSCTNYGIENAIGDGLTIKASGVIVRNAQIIGASGNGMTITGDGCIIDGGVIDGANGVGIIVNGSGNMIQNITIANCSQPIIVNGQGNIIDWSSVRTVTQPVTSYGVARTQPTSGQLANPATGIGAQMNASLINSEVQGQLLRPEKQQVQLRAREQAL